MRTDVEVVVVGGGIAGAVTAVHLAERGHDVLILDRAAFPRPKVCGEGLLPHGVTALREAGIEVPAAARPFAGIRWTMGEHTATGRFPREPGQGLRREELDAAVLGRARRHRRIEVREGAAVRGLTPVPGGLELRVGAERVRAQVVIGADGLHSQVRGWAGLEGPIGRRRRYGVRQHFALAEGVADEPWVDVFVVDGAELYVTPVGPGEVNVAALCEHDTMARFKGRLAEGFAELVRASPLGERLVGGRWLGDVAAVGPLLRSARAVVADRVVLVGDAAGFVDGITGEGMSVALHSAALAADVVSSALRAGEPTAAALRPYEERRRARVRDSERLTHLVLWGMRRRRIAERVVRSLARRPELFDRLLAIETRSEPLASFGVTGLLGLVFA